MATKLGTKILKNILSEDLYEKGYGKIEKVKGMKSKYRLKK